MAFTLESIAPYLGVAGQTLIDIDENKTGGDDFAGELLVFSADVINSVLNDEDLPEFPDVLKTGVTAKITGVSRGILTIANSLLTFVRFQVSGKATKVLKYINQAISQLLAGQPVPSAPTGL